MRKRWAFGGVLLAAVAGSAAVWEPISATSQIAPAKRAYDVEIIRDGFGVPHINGKTDADAAYGLAYAHSEDDFSTIEEVVAMTRGRYGALVGADGAKVDYVLHLLGARTTATRDYTKIPADVRAVLEGYAAGLNHYAEKHPEEVRLSKLFPVTGVDVAAGFVLRAPFFFGLDTVIEKLTEGKPVPVPSAATMTPAGLNPEANGSNAFAIAPKRMADGKTWLISNSHQPYEGHVAWYEAVVHSGEGMDMAGALFPGSPFVLLGHNRHLGWTNTVNKPDLIDVYKLELNPAGDQYKLDGRWLPLKEERVWLPLKTGPFDMPVPQSIYRSIHGPVIKNDQGAFAIRYAGIDSVKALEQYFRNTKAKNWEQWTASMSIGGIPATNFIYADKTGRIAYVYNGLFPPRKPGYDYTKVLPGNTSAALWSGTLPFERFPMLINPASGFVENANHTPFVAAGPGSELDPKDFSLLLGIELGMTNRGVRAIELLSADKSITPEELEAIKMDKAYSRKSWVGAWLPKLIAADLKDAPELVSAQRLLSSWDWVSDGNGAADAFAERVIRLGAGPSWRNEPLPSPRAALAEAVTDMKQRFGRIDPPLAEIQRLRRGSVDLPMLGGNDTLRATTIWAKDEPDGKERVRHGDSFILRVRWARSGAVISDSIQPYGAATNRPKSPHYTDQMKMFLAGNYKPVHFEWADAVKHAKRRYRP